VPDLLTSPMRPDFVMSAGMMPALDSPGLEQCLADSGFARMRPQYAGRDASASPATGLAKRHAAEQAALIAAALGHNLTDGGQAAVAAE